ncbi:MAG: DUF3524 domain-containing protein [Desulfobacteraceae bacterium]|nr:DUF3524 domain-containing protein [Desulfobacteraceae bacterium]
MNVLFLESFFSGSHKDFALGYQAHSSHAIELVTLPARFWKWRMRGAALYFIETVENLERFDVIFATDMMDVADFIALTCEKQIPIFLYFHENQLTYPLAPRKKRDFHLGMTNIISALSAGKVAFNSQFHFDAFRKEAKVLLGRMPDSRTPWVNGQLMEKSSVIYPGCHFKKGEAALEKKDLIKPLIIWNHRWEYDKNPETFFEALRYLKKNSIGFSLAVLGERYDLAPTVFESIEEEFKEELVAFGYVADRKDYEAWLKKGAIVVSCAIQENFGISVVEAIRLGCLPLLPRRLSYPEIIPETFHSQVLYESKEDLFNKLAHLVLNYTDYVSSQKALAKAMEKYSWEMMAKKFDAALENLIK